jgi:hypothetical protein
MRGFEVVVGAIVGLFVIGIVFGVLLVVTGPAFQRRFDAPRADWEEPRDQDGDGPPPWPGTRG